MTIETPETTDLYPFPRCNRFTHLNEYQANPRSHRLMREVRKSIGELFDEFGSGHDDEMRAVLRRCPRASRVFPQYLWITLWKRVLSPPSFGACSESSDKWSVGVTE
jgi:hypothetical protein